MASDPPESANRQELREFEATDVSVTIDDHGSAFHAHIGAGGTEEISAMTPAPGGEIADEPIIRFDIETDTDSSRGHTKAFMTASEFKQMSEFLLRDYDE